MKIKPKLAFRNPCIPINEMDVDKVYDAEDATNQPNWKEKGLIFAGGHLLEQGEYTIVEDECPLTVALKEYQEFNDIRGDVDAYLHHLGMWALGDTFMLKQTYDTTDKPTRKGYGLDAYGIDCD
jgi:hypothetical protein